MRMLGEFVVSMGLVLGDSDAKMILAGCVSYSIASHTSNVNFHAI
jgi:hypothetical protein